MYANTLEEQYKLSAMSLEALNRIRSKNEAKLQEEKQPKKDYARLIFEEYDEDSFSLKLMCDSIFYNCLIKRLDETYESDVQKMFGELASTTRQIYEHINIKPKLYGFNESEVQNDSQEILENKSVQLITEFLDHNYYSLTDKQLEMLYLKEVNTVAKKLIVTENVETEDAVNFALKSVIVESLINRINFPMIIKDRVNELVTSDNYGMIFDQDQLINLWNRFSEQSRSISKIVATVV